MQFYKPPFNGWTMGDTGCQVAAGLELPAVEHSTNETALTALFVLGSFEVHRALFLLC